MLCLTVYAVILFKYFLPVFFRYAYTKVFYTKHNILILKAGINIYPFCIGRIFNSIGKKVGNYLAYPLPVSIYISYIRKLFDDSMRSSGDLQCIHYFINHCIKTEKAIREL